jgi:hypothetical protein
MYFFNDLVNIAMFIERVEYRVGEIVTDMQTKQDTFFNLLQNSAILGLLGGGKRREGWHPYSRAGGRGLP